MYEEKREQNGYKSYILEILLGIFGSREFFDFSEAVIMGPHHKSIKTASSFYLIKKIYKYEIVSTIQLQFDETFFGCLRDF